MHLSLHIERTGGTSLLAEYEAYYGPEKILVYSVLTNKLVRVSDLLVSPANKSLSKLKAFVENTPVLSFFYHLYTSVLDNFTNVVPWYELNNIPDDIAVIHGHFPPEYFAEILPHSFTSVVLREPLERMISQYLHWQRAGGDMGFRIEIPYDPEMSFKDYAFQKEFHNFQTRALGNMTLEEFDLVGITSQLDRFVARLKGEPSKASNKAAQVNYMGHKPKHKELGITPQFIEKFKDINIEDYNNYHKAMTLGEKGVSFPAGKV